MNLTYVYRNDLRKVLNKDLKNFVQLYLSHKFLVIPWDKRQIMIIKIIA